MRFHARSRRGKLVFEDPRRLEQYLCSVEGKLLEVEVGPQQVRRSESQNRYYHGVVVKMAAAVLGYLPPQMHEVFKEKILGPGGSTAELTTEEFTRYVEDCRMVAAELGIIIPDPE